MALTDLDLGTAPDNGTGDNLRLGGGKINANFAHLDLVKANDSEVIKQINKFDGTPLLKDANGLVTLPDFSSGGAAKPPVDADPYTDVAALLAAQNVQEEDYFYEVTDASGFTDPDITTGNAVVLLTKTPGVDATGTEADYIVVWAKEFELGGGDTYDDTAILADLATKAKKRTIKTITTTVSYTLIAADFTDFILKFTANASEEIAVTLNAGVAPLNGELQMISTGNNKLVPTLGVGVTATYPEQTNPKTILKGWLGGIVTATDTISFNGSLESTATGGGIEEAPSDGTPYSRQDAGWVAAVGTTYAPFTNTVDGLVTAPNVAGETTYGGAITFPTEGFTVTEGDTVSVTASDSAVVAGADIEIVTSDFTGGTPWKKIKDITEKAESLTGTVLSLQKQVVDTYNYAIPSSATTYTVSSGIVVNGAVRCFINAATEPLVTGGTKISGDDFILNTTMTMVVNSPDGVSVEYYFLSR